MTLYFDTYFVTLVHVKCFYLLIWRLDAQSPGRDGLKESLHLPPYLPSFEFIHAIQGRSPAS